MGSTDIRQPPRNLELFPSHNLTDVIDSPSSQQPYNKEPSPNCVSTPNPSTKALRSEALRLATYVGWPVTFLHPQSVASAGFFYRGHGDEVQCAFCLVRISNWEPNDDPMNEHRRFMPHCPFVNELPVGNIPLSPSALKSSLTLQSPSRFPVPQVVGDAGTDACTRYVHEYRPSARAEQGVHYSSNSQNQSLGTSETSSLLGVMGSLSSLSIQTHQKAKNPAFVTLASRLGSFKDWPVGIAQRPQQLADAGFFYLGTGDKVKCFSCDKGLRDWQRDDVPWDEHARWSPECAYLLSMKGAEFVHQIHHKYNGPTENDSQDEREVMNEDVVPVKKSSSTDEGKDQRDVKDAMLCKICYMEPFCMVFLPCAHSLACVSCSSALSSCPVCRKPIERTIRAYFS